MNKAATKEFTVGSEKYTPRAATYNGIKGRIWTKRVLENGAWLHKGKQHVRSAAEEIEVIAAFVPAVDHDAVESYWDQA